MVLFISQKSAINDPTRKLSDAFTSGIGGSRGCAPQYALVYYTSHRSQKSLQSASAKQQKYAKHTYLQLNDIGAKYSQRFQHKMYNKPLSYQNHQWREFRNSVTETRPRLLTSVFSQSALVICFSRDHEGKQTSTTAATRTCKSSQALACLIIDQGRVDLQIFGPL